MKKIIYILILIILYSFEVHAAGSFTFGKSRTLGIHADNHWPTTVMSNMVFSLPFDRALVIGTNFYDASTNQCDFTVSNLTYEPLWTNGYIETDGAGDHVPILDSVKVSVTGHIMAMAWIWIDPSDGGSIGQIIDKNQINPGGKKAYVLWVAADQKGSFNLAAEIANPAIGSTSTFATATWYHIAGGYNTNGTMSFYVNGNLENTVAAVSGSGRVIDNSRGIGIGSSPDVFGTWPFTGRIDLPAVFNRKLESNEVFSIWKSQSRLH